MRINQKVISFICIAIILVLVVGKMKPIRYSADNSSDYDSYTILNFTRLDTLNNEIRSAQNRLDSINRVKKEYNEGYLSYNGFTGGLLGLVDLNQEKGKNNKKQSYLYLGSFGLEINEIEGSKYLVYHTKNDKGYLSKTKLTKKGNDYMLSYVDYPVDYRYSAEDKSLLFPIESDFTKFCVFLSIFIISIIYLAAWLFCLFTFFKFLIAISKNRAFEEGNVLRLKDLSIAFLILSLFNCTFHIITYLIFSINHSTEGVTITCSFWDYDYFILGLSTLSYLIYSAFKRGMILQEDQELTI